MLDIKFICDNVDYCKDRLQKRSGTYDVDRVVELNNARRSRILRVEAMKAERNQATDTISELKRQKKDAGGLIERMKVLGDEIKAIDSELSEIEAELAAAVLSIANIPNNTVPEGKDDTFNRVERTAMEPSKFSFEPKPHWEIGEALGILDAPTAGKITGARFTIYRGLGARLERAITNLMLDTHIANGYTEIFPPFMVNRESMTGTGQLPKFEEDAFAVKNTNYFLVPTAEVPVTNMHRAEILSAERLPIKYCAYTACFRAEAGSAGRDTRGLIRQHQFNKVEIVKFASPDMSYLELESLTNDAERILKLLKLPYRVVTLCTGDLGFSSAKTYDIEVWMPSYNRYVEISSCSNFEDFQARRMNIKYKDGQKTALVHTLNGSGLAVGRTTAAIIENYQNADGTVTVPDALLPYMGGNKIIG